MPTMRFATMRSRLMAFELLPCLIPNGTPVSPGAANGSKPSLVQSSSMPFEHLPQVLGIESLHVMAVRAAVGLVQQSHEHLHRSVMVDGAENIIEIHSTVEKAPRYVAHQGAQERVDRDDVRSAGDS